ncbi:ornithine cyclodeaminase family protein [Aminivibrio sp.]|uniref:ornithine cyclodeaminase family protein n=1 Tax=Aminivibrio sp. TaxID=1872489 RepID=UPI001A40F6B3|nr:ornithine cyclodeaminase family protein [Aminivibrio sp.]MBL3538628.1 ornithine cyclodeaminase family protein [Aminivibrio sp.]
MFLMNSRHMLSCFSFTGMMDAAEEAMKAAAHAMDGDVTVPLRTAVSRKKNSLLLMPCLADDLWGLKALAIFPDNPALSRPFLNGLVLLFDGTDGTPLALFDGRTLTALRTGSVGGAAVRALARKDVRSLGLAGAGVQGYWQVRFACGARSFSEVRIFDAVPENAERTAERLAKDLPDIAVFLCRDASELALSSDVIITATTAKQPIFPDDRRLFSGGKCIIGIGSYTPETREYPDALFAEARQVYVDTEHALSETGDLIGPLSRGLISREIIRPLSDLFFEEQRADSGGTVFFKSVGLSVFDLYAAKTLLEKGKMTGNGIEFDL